MNATSETVAKLMKVVSDETSYRIAKIRLDTSINFDIGVDGEDAIELFERLAEEFHIQDFSDLEWDRYFGSEHETIVSFARRVLRGTPLPRREPLTIGFLADYIEGKRIPKGE